VQNVPLPIDASALIEAPRFDRQKGVWTFVVESAYQRGPNAVEVLLPDRWEAGRRHRVLYVLPVQPGIGGPWGDGLQLVRALGVHNEHDLICVAPAFDTWPYYGSHASDPAIRHEEYLLRVLVPLIESRYTTHGAAEGRLLFGFSKSGWGAFLLTLRNPDFFGYACSWDAPMMVSERNFGLYETASHFGTREHMARYVPREWARRNAAHFRQRERLVLLGRNFFGTRWLHDLPHTSGFHRLLRRLDIPHHYDNGIKVAHTWNHGWMKPAIAALMKIANADSPSLKDCARQ
jgi:hypothetical protein